MNSRPFAEPLVDFLLQFCWNLSRGSFWKGFSLPQKRPEMTLTFFFLLHDYPLALGSGLDGVNINHRMADGQRNTLQVPNAAEVISKDAETHIVAGMAKSAFSQIHGVPPIFVQKRVLTCAELALSKRSLATKRSISRLNTIVVATVGVSWQSFVLGSDRAAAEPPNILGGLANVGKTRAWNSSTKKGQSLGKLPIQCIGCQRLPSSPFALWRSVSTPDREVMRRKEPCCRCCFVLGTSLHIQLREQGGTMK
jgi:hypothetical protein